MFRTYGERFEAPSRCSCGEEVAELQGKSSRLSREPQRKAAPRTRVGTSVRCREGCAARSGRQTRVAGAVNVSLRGDGAEGVAVWARGNGRGYTASRPAPSPPPGSGIGARPVRALRASRPAAARRHLLADGRMEKLHPLSPFTLSPWRPASFSSAASRPRAALPQPSSSIRPPQPFWKHPKGASPAPCPPGTLGLTLLIAPRLSFGPAGNI